MIGSYGAAISIPLIKPDIAILALGYERVVKIIAKVIGHAFGLKLVVIVAYDVKIFERAIEEWEEIAHQGVVELRIVA